MDKANEMLVRHGPIHFFARGTTWPHTVGYFNSGDKVGEWKYFHRDTQKIWVVGSFEKDKGTGIWRMWEPQGKMIFIGTWDQFILQRKSEQSNDGRWIVPIKKKGR